MIRKYVSDVIAAVGRFRSNENLYTRVKVCVTSNTIAIVTLSFTRRETMVVGFVYSRLTRLYPRRPCDNSGDIAIITDNKKIND